MGYINQASASASNSPKITISRWVNLPTACSVQLLEFGPPNGVEQFSNSYVYVLNNGTTGNAVGVLFSGVVDSVTGPDLIPYLTTTDETHDTSWQAAVDPSVAWTPLFTTQASSIGSLIDPGVWFHLLVAADFTNETAFGGACDTFFIFVNGVRRTLDTGQCRIVDQATGQVQSSLQPTTGVPGLVIEYNAGPFTTTRTVSGGFTATAVGHTPGFPLDLNGTEIGIPAQAAHAAGGVTENNAAIRADVQIWVGTYIDPLTDIDKFISGGRPVNPTIAEAAFGAPMYRFNRPADDITNDTGTGGAFAKTGTVTDFTPGP